MIKTTSYYNDAWDTAKANAELLEVELMVLKYLARKDQAGRSNDWYQNP